MEQTETDVTISSRLVKPPATGGADDATLGSSDEAASQEGWQKIIDELLRWSGDTSLVTYDEVESPLPERLLSAIDFAVDARDTGQSPPTAFSPSVDGGVAFEWRSGREVQVVEICGVGIVEITELGGDEVVSHYQLTRDPRHRGWLKAESD